MYPSTIEENILHIYLTGTQDIHYRKKILQNPPQFPSKMQKNENVFRKSNRASFFER